MTFVGLIDPFAGSSVLLVSAVRALFRTLLTLDVLTVNLEEFAWTDVAGDGQFRSDLRKPWDYKRDIIQSRNQSHNVSTCRKQRKMICHSSGHLFQS